MLRFACPSLFPKQDMFTVFSTTLKLGGSIKVMLSIIEQELNFYNHPCIVSQQC